MPSLWFSVKIKTCIWNEVLPPFLLCLLNKPSIRKASRLVKWHGSLRVNSALEPFTVRSGKESACNGGRPRFDPRVGKIPWRRQWLPTPVFLPGESQGRRSMTGDSPWGYKELDMAEQLLQAFSRLNLFLLLLLLLLLPQHASLLLLLS